MNILQEIYLFAAQAMLVAVLLCVLPARLMKDMAKRRLLVLALLLLSLFVPLFGLTVAQWLRSVVGDVSVISTVLFVHIIMQRLFSIKLIEDESKKAGLLAIIAVGIVFYPLALGLGFYDPYQLGFSPLYMSLLLCLLSLLAWFSARRSLAVIILLPLLAFNLHLLESGNLWDYLIDPIVLIYALVQSVSVMRLGPLSKKRGSA